MICIKDNHCNELFPQGISLTQQDCRSGNTREVLIFAYFARRTNLRIKESREYYFKSATKDKRKLTKSNFRGKSHNGKFAKIWARVIYKIYSISSCFELVINSYHFHSRPS